MKIQAWSKDAQGYWRKAGDYDMRICRTDSPDKEWYLWRIWGPVKVGPSIVKRLLKSGCVTSLSYAKQSCVRAMNKHRKESQR